MAFFQAKHFRGFMSDAQAAMAAKEANSLFDQYGTPLFGVRYSDGSCKDFSTEKKANDTHVGLALDISMMGKMEPSKVPVKLDRPTEEDLTAAQADKLRDLEKQNAVLQAQLQGRTNV